MPWLSRRRYAPELEVLAHRHALEALAALGRLADARAARSPAAAGCEISSPSSRIEPVRGGVSPEIERSVVDLPAPLEPISVTHSPSSTSA